MKNSKGSKRHRQRSSLITSDVHPVVVIIIIIILEAALKCDRNCSVQKRYLVGGKELRC